MRIHVLFFALLRDRAGVAETTLELRESASVADAAQTLAEKFPAIAQFLARTAFAVNQSYAPTETRLSDGDELALIPPVSGG
jgi:molybdopterin synthase catalytic subunit